MTVTSLSAYDFYNNIDMGINVTAQLKTDLKMFEIKWLSENSVRLTDLSYYLYSNFNKFYKLPSNFTCDLIQSSYNLSNASYLTLFFSDTQFITVSYQKSSLLSPN